MHQLLIEIEPNRKATEQTTLQFARRRNGATSDEAAFCI